MQKHGLEAILIGNAGAAIHGAPVTTIDFDFMFRDTPDNMRKLKAVAKELKAVILRPYYPRFEVVPHGGRRSGSPGRFHAGGGWREVLQQSAFPRCASDTRKRPVARCLFGGYCGQQASRRPSA
jgi:hypothetical protein